MEGLFCEYNAAILNACFKYNNAVKTAFVIEEWIDWSKYGTIYDKTYQVVTHFKFRKGHINAMNHTDHVGLYTDNGWVAI
jgi:hypothetical protein